MTIIGEYIKKMRKIKGITQKEFALRSGLGLRFVRDLEQGKETCRMDKVNQALNLFDKELVPGDKKFEPLPPSDPNDPIVYPQYTDEEYREILKHKLDANRVMIPREVIDNLKKENK